MAGVALEVVLPMRGTWRLLESVCVSLSPTTAPDGAATAVIALVPLPFTRPVSVAAPVPPLATGKTDEPTSLVRLMLLFVASEPRPRLVRAVAALAISDRLFVLNSP